MPVYEYECASCGGFTQSRPMAQSGQPAPCPACARAAARVLSATSVAGARRGRKRGQPEPRLVTRQREPVKPKLQAAHGDRPWMLGH